MPSTVQLPEVQVQLTSKSDLPMVILPMKVGLRSSTTGNGEPSVALTTTSSKLELCADNLVTMEQWKHLKMHTLEKGLVQFGYV